MVSETESRSKVTTLITYQVEWLTRTRQFGTMTEKVADYERLLRDLATRANDHDAQLIRSVLDKVAIPWISKSLTLTVTGYLR